MVAYCQGRAAKGLCVQWQRWQGWQRSCAVAKVAKIAARVARVAKVAKVVAEVAPRWQGWQRWQTDEFSLPPLGFFRFAHPSTCRLLPGHPYIALRHHPAHPFLACEAVRREEDAIVARVARVANPIFQNILIEILLYK